MVFAERLFTILNKTDLIQVKIPDGKFIKVKGKGTVKLKT